MKLPIPPRTFHQDMRTRILICSLALAGVVANVAVAEDIYVAQSAAGSGTGADAANARSLAWLNTSSNWGVGVGIVGPGDTVHLVGTFTSQLAVQSSGSAGNVITLYFERNAKFSAATWPTGAIRVAGKNYITIDGGINGLIECTNNGTSLGNRVNSIGIHANAASNFTVQNLTLSNLYVRSGTTDSSAGATAIQNNCDAAPWFIINFTVSNCTIHDCTTGIDTDYGGLPSSNYTFTGNTIYNINWGGCCGDRGPGAVLNNLVVSKNRIYGFSKWNDTVNNAYHHNGFFAWAVSGGRIDGIYYYKNKVGPDFGNQYSTTGLWASGNVSNVFMLLQRDSLQRKRLPK